jgi:predicted nuclease with TOPRIM domain
MRTEPLRFVEKISELQSTVEDLRSRNDELKAERDRLLEENRALRRQITHSRLLSGLEDTIDTIKAETGHLPAAPPPAEQLYYTLPPSFSFTEFFRIAENESLETDEARRCLLHFLAQDLVVQEGSRLVKDKETR